MKPHMIINVREIEELQMIRDSYSLELIFEKARSIVVQGGIVSLVRKQTQGPSEPFEKLDTEDALASYKNAVLKYV